MRRRFFLVLCYALATALWIFGSDQLILWLDIDPGIGARLQAIRAWTLVGVTALFLFFLLQMLETERWPKTEYKSLSPADWKPLALFLLVVAFTVFPGSYSFFELTRQLSETAISTCLLAWFSFVLVFGLVAGMIGILFWWRNVRTRFLLERLRIDLERATLRHRFETLLRQSLDVVVLLAEDGTIIEINDRTRDYYGREPEDLRGRLVWELRHPNCRNLWGADYERVARMNGAVFERLHLRQDGTPFPVEVSARPLRDQGHRYFQSVVRDISERKRTEAALAAQELRFRATFEQAAVGMAHVAPEGNWLLVNDCLCTMLGYSRRELLQKTYHDITHPDDREKDNWVVKQLLTGQIHTYWMEKRYFHQNGNIVWISLTASLLRDADGQPDYFIVVIEDITSRKRIEQRLARISRFYGALNLTHQTILHNSETAEQLFEDLCRIAVKYGELKGAWVGMLDAATQELRVAAAFGELRGRLVSLGEPVAKGSALPYQPARKVLSTGEHWLDNDLLYTEAEDTDWQILVATTGVRSCAAFPLKCAGAVVGVFSLYASEPEFFDAELVRLLDGMAADVSFALENFEREAQRQRVGAALRDSESRYRALFEAYPAPMWVYDLMTLDFLAVNDAAVSQYGYSREDFLAMTIADIRPKEEVGRLRQYVAQLQEGLGRSEIWKHRRRDGSLLEVESISHAIDWGGRRARVVLIQDMTEQMWAQRQLPLTTICEQSAEGILVSDWKNNIVFVNRAFTQITGYRLDEIRGCNPHILASGRHDQEFFQAMWATLGETGYWQGKIWNRRKNGEIYAECLRITALRDPKNRISHYIGIFHQWSADAKIEDSDLRKLEY